MKKIISILCVMAMIFSFAAFNASAADNGVSLVVKSQDAESTVLALTINSTYNVGSYSIYIDVAEAVAAGATVTATNVAGSKAQYNSSQKMVVATFAPTDGSSIPAGEDIELATIAFSAVDAEFVVDKKAETSRTKYVVESKEDDGSIVTRTSEYPFTGVTVAPFSTGETVNTVDVSKAVTVTTEAAATDCQIGSAVAMTANAGEAAFTKMKWAITTEAGRLFSKTITFDLPVSGEFSVAATFINGAHNEKFDVEPVAPATISEVGAIFTDGTADYFTNEADAAFKAE